jgi:hypothetical protein
MMTDRDLTRASELLGLLPADLRGMRTPEGLKALKQKAKKGYREAAMRLHPDRTGGDAEKTEDFKLVSVLARQIEQMEPPKVKVRTTYKIRVTVRVPTPTHMG